ncbi:pecanex-like protein 4 isoform X3 [Polyodon spathula]|uniref:pecanex-like protein 4 isoform X3 n=1 Tax=Polyodon spathula TaxID=7913 RepID=UPI001B7DA3F1|nr:pecanex-like protein 4 isoform X3 [Polyodon spathula]
MGPDVPLLNEYKQEFFWKRFPQTVLGGPQFKLGYCAPPYIYVNQIILFLTPWVFGGVGTLLYQLRLLEDYYAAVLSGGLMVIAASVVQIINLCARRRTVTVERLQSQNILTDEEEFEFASCAGSETIKFIIPGKKFIVNTIFHTVLAGALCGLGTWYLLLNRLSSLYNNTGAAVMIFVFGFNATIPDLQQANQALHIIFLFLPLLWALGILSPVDAVFLWGMEQTLVFGLGGSAMATNIRLVVMFLVSVGVAIGTYFIPSSLGVILFTTGMGFILSLDFSQVELMFQSCCRSPDAQADLRDMPCSLGWRLGWKEFFIYLTILMAALAEAGLLHHFGTISETSATSPQAIVSYILISLLVVSWILREIQGAYVFYGVFRNPFYPQQIRNLKVFKQKQSGLMKAGIVRRLLINLVSPFAMIGFLAMDISLQSLHTATLCVGFTRAFRTVSIIWDRLIQFFSKLKFALTVLISSWTEKKQRRKSTATHITINAVLFPMLLAVIALSAVFSAPLFPLFTLPVFLVGFPRPVRSWPGTVGAAACMCPDSVYYQQMLWSLTEAFRTAFATGSLGVPSPGTHFLCRFQDRVMWVMVLERGFSYCSLNIKGLELQETSCHTAEARKVDELFEMAFEQEEKSTVNHHFSNILTPCAALPVCLYSDARNVLTGIIDSHDNLKQMKDDFVKILFWVLLQYCSKKSKTLEGTVPEDTGGAKPAQDVAEQFVVVNVPTIKSFIRKTPSLNSETFDDWSDDDDLFGPEPTKKKTGIHNPAPKQASATLPGSVEMQSPFCESFSVTSTDKAWQALGFGLPAIDKGRELERLSEAEAVPMVIFSSSHSKQLNVPQEWRSSVLPGPRMQQLTKLFPEGWYKSVLSQLDIANMEERPSDILEGVLNDGALMDLYAHVVMTCYGVTLGAESTVLSPSYVYRVYCGDVPWTVGLDWLTGKPELFQLVLKAFRYTFKLMFDKASLGMLEDFSELANYLEEYERDWYIGRASDARWQQAVLQKKPYLFSLGHDPTMGTYTGRVLTLQEWLVHVGKLNSEGIRGQWANLSWELLYATNDDEERYSIQAHPVLLRNLTVQAADPPLGYPIYSSTPVHVPLF